ncbi:SusD/RagB family nutrient-binding outer membrane lipoprotein [Aquimarina sp. 2201CG5-10]|uniref:SusD/RagB family nutrient-binding outer membrane lipoprotein n=1 Tax=Aquimarina callyspongiae TaxID=3098150 RepID=UPI002AB3D6AD|nr:SusD/RagB family nutrient-binding outer membrane lipoprotein [Aquimarina sp. 2201CG5-10]MDY8133985.1 SusD/RagB family nutrient-binding outer membrane lipoprotein [Aquimarina sp. 2201CG5-10]
MKNILINRIGILFLSFSILLISGCEDSIEGINTDPLAATNIAPDLLMPEVLLGGITANRTIESIQMGTHSQQISFSAPFGVFLNPERGTISTNTTNNLFFGNYTTGLRNLQQMRVLTERNNPTATNIIGQAKVLEAFIYLNLTQVFGSVPFSEAIQVEDFPTPNFDTQEEILRGIPVLIDEAIAALATDTDIVEAPADLIYGGDRENWIRFGNSLKLKALMLIANVDPTSVQAQLQEVANQPLITANEFEAQLDYLDVAGNQNPIYTLIVQFAGSVNQFYAAGTPLVNIMNANNDPRRATYFDDVVGNYVGQDQGVFTYTPNAVSQVSLNIVRPEMPDRYSTASEVNFYLAEAALNGWISGDANTYYRAGISASLDYYDGQPGAISQAAKNAYLASPRATITGDSQAVALTKIHEEQYVADFTRSLETWTDIRRNKVPAYQPIIGTVLTDNIRRYQIPLSEITSNPNAPDVVPLITPMYFEN